MSRIINTVIFSKPSTITPKKFWRDSYGRNTPSEGVEIIKNVKFDLIKILESAEGLCRGFLVHEYWEDLPLLSLKNFGGIPMGGTPLPRGLKIIKNVKFDIIKILESAEGLCLGFLVHEYWEDLLLLSLKNFGGIPMGGTPYWGGENLKTWKN